MNKILIVGLILIFFLFSLAFCDNYAEIKQKGGDYNIAKIEQVEQGKNYVEVEGYLNKIEIKTEGWNKGEALIFGSGNTNCFESFFPFFGQDFLTNFFQQQLGKENQQRVVVEGSNNLVSQFQKGDNNFQNLFVEGNNNWVKQIQQGDNNTSIAEIMGNSNVFFHLQKGSGFITPTIEIVGNGKEVSIIQE